MTPRDDLDGQATSGRAERRKNQRTRQAGRVLARAAWLDAPLVFWTGTRQDAPRLPDTLLPLRAVLQDRLAELPVGLYAVRVGFPTFSLSAPRQTPARSSDATLAGGPLRLEVTAIEAVTQELVGDTARAIEAATRYPKAGTRFVGSVDRWRQGALARLDARRRAVEGATAWRAGTADALALEARVLWLGAGLPPSATLSEWALSSRVRNASESDLAAAHLAAIALGSRRLDPAHPAWLPAWVAAGRCLDRWPAAAVAWVATIVGAEALIALAADAPGLNDALAAPWLEERALDHTLPTTQELAALASLLSSMAVVGNEPSRRHDLLRRLAIQYLQFARTRSPGGGALTPQEVGEAFRDLALDQVYGQVRDLVGARRQRLPANVDELVRCWVGEELLGPQTFAYVDNLLADAADALGRHEWARIYADPPTSLSGVAPSGSALDPAGSAILLTVANRLRWKGASNALETMATWLDTCRSVVRLAPFWRDVLAIVPSHAAWFDVERARALVESLACVGRDVVAEIALGGSERGSEARALLPAALARGPDATARVLRHQLRLPDEDALDAALHWIDQAERRPRGRGADPEIPVPRSVFDVSDSVLRNVLLAIGLRAWHDGGAGAREVERLLAALADDVSRSGAACWRTSGPVLIDVVAPLVRRVLGRTSEATRAASGAPLRLIHIILDACARWSSAGFGDTNRLARILADRWTSAEQADEAWNREEDDRDELLVGLSEGRIPRLIALLQHPPAPRKYPWRAADGWALVVAHRTAHAWVSACLDRTELVPRVVHLLERIALVTRLDPGLTVARFFEPLDTVLEGAPAWPLWVTPDAREALNQVVLASAVTGCGAGQVPGALKRVLDRATTDARELAVLRARAGGRAPSMSERARRAKLEQLLAEPNLHAADLRAELGKVLPKQLALAGLAALESLARHDLEQRWRHVLGGDCPSVDSPAWDNALHMLSSVTHNRRVLVRLLRHAARGDHVWMRDLAPNKRFIEGLLAAGLLPDQWLAERSLAIVSPSGPLRADATADPLEVLQMGSLFGTCLSAGKFNAHAAVAAAVEVNKRVVYVRDGARRVVGRQLLAITRTGEVIGFTSYGAAAEEPGRHGAWVKLALELLALDLARASGARLMPTGRVAAGLDDAEERSLMLFCRGYVDSPEPFDWWIEALAAADPRSGQNDRAVLRALLEQPVPPHLDARACPDWKRSELGWAACRALLWLGAEAPSLSAEHVEMLGLEAPQRALLRSGVPFRGAEGAPGKDG